MASNNQNNQKQKVDLQNQQQQHSGFQQRGVPSKEEVQVALKALLNDIKGAKSIDEFNQAKSTSGKIKKIKNIIITLLNASHDIAQKVENSDPQLSDPQVSEKNEVISGINNETLSQNFYNECLTEFNIIKTNEREIKNITDVLNANDAMSINAKSDANLISKNKPAIVADKAIKGIQHFIKYSSETIRKKGLQGQIGISNKNLVPLHKPEMYCEGDTLLSGIKRLYNEHNLGNKNVNDFIAELNTKHYIDGGVHPFHTKTTFQTIENKEKEEMTPSEANAYVLKQYLQQQQLEANQQQLEANQQQLEANQQEFIIDILSSQINIDYKTLASIVGGEKDGGEKDGGEKDGGGKDGEIIFLNAIKTSIESGANLPLAFYQHAYIFCQEVSKNVSKAKEVEALLKSITTREVLVSNIKQDIDTNAELFLSLCTSKPFDGGDYGEKHDVLLSKLFEDRKKNFFEPAVENQNEIPQNQQQLSEEEQRHLHDIYDTLASFNNDISSINTIITLEVLQSKVNHLVASSDKNIQSLAGVMMNKIDQQINVIVDAFKKEQKEQEEQEAIIAAIIQTEIEENISKILLNTVSGITTNDLEYTLQKYLTAEQKQLITSRNTLMFGQFVPPEQIRNNVENNANDKGNESLQILCEDQDQSLSLDLVNDKNGKEKDRGQNNNNKVLPNGIGLNINRGDNKKALELNTSNQKNIFQDQNNNQQLNSQIDDKQVFELNANNNQNANNNPNLNQNIDEQQNLNISMLSNISQNINEHHNNTVVKGMQQFKTNNKTNKDIFKGGIKNDQQDINM